jgi:hypothetical protein
MPYIIAGEAFQTKQHLTERCRDILAATPDGASVSPEYLPFLFGLFRYHDGWADKSDGGVQRITTQTTEHGTRCFVITRIGGDSIDISFPHAIKLIPSTRKQELLPQGLLDYRSAARTAIAAAIWAFRDLALVLSPTCPITGEAITRDAYAVDHVAPLTFDRLLYDFSLAQRLNPLAVPIRSHNGTVAVFEDSEVAARWVAYHNENARLRLLSRAGHAQLPTERIDWTPILQPIPVQTTE